MPKAKARTSKLVEEKHIGSEPKPGSSILSNLETIHALNYYNYFCDRKQSIEFLHEHLEKSDPIRLISVRKIDDYKITPTLGYIARMLDRGCVLSQSTIDFFDRNMIDIMRFVPEPKERKQREEKIPSIDFELIAEIEEELDKFVFESNFKGKFVFNEWAQAKSLNAVNATRLRDKYIPLLNELEMITKDKEIKEGYGDLTAPKRKAYIEFVSAIISGCETIIQNKKQVRKPRKKKAVKVENLIKGLKYQEREPTLNIQSIHPSKIVGAEQMVTFNTKTRKLSNYFALPGKKFSLKGSTLLEVDLDKSYEKTLRKPSETLPEVMKSTKRTVKVLMEKLTTTNGKIDSGRINKNHVLLMVF